MFIRSRREKTMSRMRYKLPARLSLLAVSGDANILSANAYVEANFVINRLTEKIRRLKQEKGTVDDSVTCDTFGIDVKKAESIANALILWCLGKDFLGQEDIFNYVFGLVVKAAQDLACMKEIYASPDNSSCLMMVGHLAEIKIDPPYNGRDSLRE